MIDTLFSKWATHHLSDLAGRAIGNLVAGSDLPDAVFDAVDAKLDDDIDWLGNHVSDLFSFFD